MSETLKNTEKLDDTWEEYVNYLTDEQILDGKFDTDKLRRNPEDFHLNEYAYSILQKTELFDHYEMTAYGKKAVGKRIGLEKAAHLMVGLTQNIIYQIDKGGSEPLPDEIIYLDKSGRPVSWLVNMFWDDFASRNGGSVIERPKHSYVNIDRGRVLESFFGMTRCLKDSVEDKYGNWYPSFAAAWDEAKKQLTQEHFAQLRALYLDEKLKDDNYSPEVIFGKPSRLDGKNILIIDEVKGGGTTLKMAKTLFEKAFPECKIQCITFWPESAEESVPPWYDRDNVEGRGIGDPDPSFYEDLAGKYSDTNYFKDLGVPEEDIPKIKEVALSRIRAKRIGKNLLGIPLNLDKESGGLSRKLASDFKQLHKDYLEHKIVPYFNGAVEDDRFYIETVRQGINPTELQKIIDEVFKNNPRKNYRG